MPALFEMPLSKWEDGILTIALDPPTPIGGWDIRFQVQRRFGSASGLFLRSCASGFQAGQSGITVVNSGQGIFDIDARSLDTSGLDFGNYAAAAQRYNSGFRTALSQGFLVLYPNIG